MDVRTGRWMHYLLLIAAWAVLTLPELGTHSLWDMDEGVNAEAAREMREAETWIVPTYNYQLRTAKPVLLYWLQRASFAAFDDVSEWTARFPSALCALATILLTYEFGRRLYNPVVGLLSGMILASAIEFCLLAHAATPDSPLLFFTVLSYFLFWTLSRNGSRAWMTPVGVACGLAVLTKGPVGVVLPGLVIGLYLLWLGRLREVITWRSAVAFGAFLLTALPWYILIGVETRGAYLREFFGNENVNRFLAPKENHRGPIVYHAVLLFVFFAPWSIFLIPTVWQSCRDARQARRPDPLPPGTDEARFLLCWVFGYLAFFSIAATKLPNYVLPIYPPLALLTARLLDGRRTQRLSIPAWLIPAGLASLGIVAVVTAVGLVIASGQVPIPGVKVPPLPGLEQGAWFALIPFVGMVATLVWYRTNWERTLGILVGTAIAFVASLGAWGAVTLDQHKAPRGLVADAKLNQPHREIRIGAADWFQHSIVFYAQREVGKIVSVEELHDFLAMPIPSYLLISEAAWEMHASKVPVPTRIIAKRYDFYRKTNVLVVANPYVVD